MPQCKHSTLKYTTALYMLTRCLPRLCRRQVLNLGSSCFGLLSSWGIFKCLTCAIRTGFLFLLEIRSPGYSLVLGHISMVTGSKVQGLKQAYCCPLGFRLLLVTMASFPLLCLCQAPLHSLLLLLIQPPSSLLLSPFLLPPSHPPSMRADWLCFCCRLGVSLRVFVFLSISRG